MAVRQTGISLVELMIAMTIGLIMIGGAFTIFIQVKRSYNENEKLMYMQDDARFALSELTRDIASAGFFGELSDPASLGTDTSLTISQDCGPPATAWAYDVTTQIETLDNTNGATAATQYSCIDPGAFQDGTDVLAVKRTIGSISTPPLSAGQVYVKSNGVVALLFQHPEDVPSAVPVPLPATNWTYTPSVWYVRNHASEVDPNDGIPTLCRKFLDTSGAPSMVEECIARGVEDLQFEFGIDTDGDGAADRYLPDPDAAALARLVTVRILLLARSMEAQVGYKNEKSYQLSNRPPWTPDDNFFRRVYTATVSTRNLHNQARLGI